MYHRNFARRTCEGGQAGGGWSWDAWLSSWVIISPFFASRLEPALIKARDSYLVQSRTSPGYPEGGSG
jgi:hypothetical protein